MIFLPIHPTPPDFEKIARMRMAGTSFDPDPNYDLIKPLPPASKGIQCGECGAKFEHGKAYGFVCGSMRCPVQLKTTC